FDCGSVREVVENGVTGYVVGSMSEAERVLGRVLALDRRVVRRRFEQRFSAERMAQDYLKLYASLIARSAAPDSIDEEPSVIPSTPGLLN
ncbi:MAG: hypothetical protein ACXWCH_35345, partial [Burkholderiales bacterium]